MPIDLFGFTIGKKGKQPPSPQSGAERKVAKSFAPPDYDDGAVTVSGGGYFGSYVDFEGSIKTEVDLIHKYRDMANHAECEQAIDDITNDTIIYDDTRKSVSVILDEVDLPDTIKNKITTEFDEILKLLHFKRRGYEIFRKWYIDGKLYFHIILDEKTSKKGISELRPIDSTKIRKVRKVNKGRNPTGSIDTQLVDSIEEFYVYSDQSHNSNSTEGLRIALDSISYNHSGLYDSSKKRVIGYLHKAIKPLNQLRMIEDAVVIYRISRAPERRIFYVDVGNLPKMKAEQYLRDVMNRFRNKLVYDAETGEIRDDKRHMSMMEDFWMPRREGGRGTEISTLDGGQNLGEMDDVEYFKKKLYRSLNIPVSRLEADNGFNMGRSAEITRDELKFFKFIERVRVKFSELFLNCLRVQVITKGIMTEDDWNSIVQDIDFDFVKDSYFTELKESEILKERMEVLQTMDEYIGKYYSIEHIRRNILRQTDDDIKEIDSQIKQEKDSGQIEGDEDEDQY
jgi:hypothetical protein